MISILSKAATWSPEQPFGEAFSRVFSSRLCSAQLIWTAVVEVRVNRSKKRLYMDRIEHPQAWTEPRLKTMLARCLR